MGGIWKFRGRLIILPKEAFGKRSKTQRTVLADLRAVSDEHTDSTPVPANGQRCQHAMFWNATCHSRRRRGE